VEQLDDVLAQLEQEASPPTLVEVLMTKDVEDQWFPQEGSRYFPFRTSHDPLSHMRTVQLSLDLVEVAMLLTTDDKWLEATERCLFLERIPYSWAIGMNRTIWVPARVREEAVAVLHAEPVLARHLDFDRWKSAPR
jgi:hypothetical protein